MTSVAAPFFFFAFFFFLVSCDKFSILSNFKYGYNDVGLDNCNYTSEPCAKLNDVWGYEFEEDGKTQYYAIVGVENGIDIVDVTDPKTPKRVKWFHGCINNWRDMKVWDTTLYGITEYTTTCNCDEDTPCAEHMDVLSPEGEKSVRMAEGRLTVPLANVTNQTVVGDLVAVVPWDDKACNIIENPTELVGKIALIPQGDCSFAEKILRVQDAGAISVVIINDVDQVVYPGMAGEPDGINITGVLIGRTDGDHFKDLLDQGTTVTVSLTHNNLQQDPLYSPPEGLTIIDMSDPRDPELVTRRRTEFQFSHNVFVEFDRPYLYVCGMSDRQEGQIGFGDLSNGGLFVYDISENTTDPRLISVWNESYIHDMMVAECEGSYILFTAAIYDDYVYIFNATDPSNLVELLRYHGRQGMAHNIWVDKTCQVMYVTHEQGHEPITVWEFFKDEEGKILWQDEPKYLGSLSVNQFEGSLPHNVFVEDDILWSSYYSEGVVAWDISEPTKPSLLAHEDTSDFTSGFFGVWGVYPFASSGYVYASDREEGLFVLELKRSSSSEDDSDFDVAEGVAIFFGILSGILLIVLLAMVAFYYVKLRGRGDYSVVSSA
eukprot:CAMPEP_0174261528 /NCGR_PEP_ID=MMETSP0439-20130205/11478_1 /TAXON_ID=0 /ORGANISM="Stereomyxa ramosa, Strain Chinc5" /LENGTH=601 /DNA_ID=CAMNT_0015346011 /DNA_START=75 /DNA_END=1880 /DNA_ORIENTATION=-